MSTATPDPASLPADPLAEKKQHPRYKVTRYSLPWAVFFPLIWWELEMIRTGRMGGPLSHVAWAAYGDRYSLRWWLCSSVFGAWAVWLTIHFAFITPALRELGVLLGVGIVVALAGWLLTR